MSKILVVDDESLIRQWIVMCLEAGGISKTEIDQAANGNEALSFINSNHYGLIFTDITMPKLDGISLIKAIREVDENVPVIILTCHEDFSFAQTAVKYRVSEYLLKNELNKEDIINTLRTHYILSQDSPEQFRQREHFLCTLIHGNPEIAVTLTDLKKHSVDLEETPIFAMAFRCTSLDAGDFMHTASNLLKHVCCFYDGMHLHILFGNISTGVQQEKLLSEQLKDLVRRNSKDAPCFGKLCIHNHISTFSKLLQEAVLSWELQFFNSSGRQISHGNSSAYKTAKGNIAEKKAMILLHFNANGHEWGEKMILGLCQEFINEQLWDSSFFKRTIIDIIEEIENSLDLEPLSIKEFIRFVKNADSHSDVIRQIHCFFQKIPEKDDLTDYIQNARKYITCHYNEPLTLASLAGMACLSEEYFSRLFKKETGINFTEYLIEVRMSKALKLLLNSDFNVNEIAEMVGIQNPSYFSSQFKKFHGFSPTAVREHPGHHIKTEGV